MKLRLWTGFWLAAIPVALTGCFSERHSGLTEPAEAACSLALNSPVFGSAQALVAMRDFAFFPAEIRVPRGTTVTWVNCEPPTIDPHTSTSDGRLWASSLLGSGETFSRMFREVGRFPYHCEPHPFMKAVVIVE
jgi:plastocyanin